MYERPGQRQGYGQQQPHPQAPGEKCPHAQVPSSSSARCSGALPPLSRANHVPSRLLPQSHVVTGRVGSGPPCSGRPDKDAKPYVVRLGRHEGPPQQPHQDPPRQLGEDAQVVSQRVRLGRPDRLLACDAPVICTASRPSPARRTGPAAFVLQIAGQQPVPEGEIRAVLRAETTGDDRGE